MNSNISWDHALTIGTLVTLICVYLYLLLSPTQPHVLTKPRNFVIVPDTEENYLLFLKSMSQDISSSRTSEFYDDIFSANSSGEFSEWGAKGKGDDFFLEYIDDKGKGESKEPFVPNEPSKNFRCKEGWLTIRSELNYKYLWLHADEKMWMGATATMDTPLSRKAFWVTPVVSNCSDGWVILREADMDSYVMMVGPSGDFAVDEWALRAGTSNVTEALINPAYHFLLEEDGYLLNKGAMAFVNVMTEAEYSVRGHTGGWDRAKPAGREYSAMVRFTFLNESLVRQALDKDAREEKEAAEQDKVLIGRIERLPTSSEKRVISFGLYGAKDKYTIGAIHNAEMAKTYFPGWVCRFYVTSDVPEEIISQLKVLGSEILPVPSGMGYSSGMFWRFMVADDPTVDRYIVRDVDSRLNSRDRLAVEEWIQSGKGVHILRDHINHCIVMNGGMWGGVKGAVTHMKELVMSWSSRDEYMADLHFLEQKVWPQIKEDQLSHDSYCCDRFSGTKPFPTQRSYTYQHVGQVFDSHDNPRLMDIDGFIRGVPIPAKCRKNPEWIYG